MFKGSIEHRTVSAPQNGSGGSSAVGAGGSQEASLKTLIYSGAWPVTDRIFHVVSTWTPHTFEVRAGDPA